MIWSEIKREILNSSSSITILILFFGLLLQFLIRTDLEEVTNVSSGSSGQNHDRIWTKNLKHITLVNSSVFTPQDQHYYTIKKVFIVPPLL